MVAQDKIAEVTIESDLQRSDLDRIMRAHRVNNVAMCTSVSCNASF